MPEKPIAKLELDTRAMGPIPCEQCDAENEHVVLTSSGAVTCPECGASLPAFEQFSSLITSVSPADEDDEDGAHVCDDDCRGYGCSLRRRR